MSAVTTPAAVAVPLLDLKKQDAGIREEVKRVVEELFESHVHPRPAGRAFEKAVADLCRDGARRRGCRRGPTLSSPRDGPRHRAGRPRRHVPVHVLLDGGGGREARRPARLLRHRPRDLQRRPGKLAKAITPKTKAIQPVHLFGQCAEWSRPRRGEEEGDPGHRRRVPVARRGVQGEKGRRDGGVRLSSRSFCRRT